MGRKDFRSHNKAFTCQKCQEENPPAQNGERNHCRKCLHSLHVDAETPGDRKSTCCGLMEPVRIDYKGAKGFMVVHRCIICGKEIANRTASDDTVEKLNRFLP